MYIYTYYNYFIYNLKSWEKIADRFVTKVDPTFYILTQKAA
jgi:hypothetical protein